MRKVFREAYEHLDQGVHRSDLLATPGLKSSSIRALHSAFEHYDRTQDFDQTAFDTEHTVVGMDEVGRGPLAGPLVAVCIILHSPPPLLPFLRDSKKLSSDEREALVPRIEAAASRLGYGTVEPEEFGKAINLHHLTFLAMTRAIEDARLPDNCALLVDGKFKHPLWPGPQRAVIKGDDSSLRIAAASVLAKVHRDRVMTEACRKYPEYGFSRNVGYGTEEHCRAILQHGPSPIHRKNFVASLLAKNEIQLSLL